MAEAIFGGLGYVFRRLLLAPTGNMVITRHRVVRAAAEHLVERHAGTFALDIPKRFVHGGERFIVYRSTTPVCAEVGALPQILDSIGILADQPRLEMLFERG